MHRPDYTPDYRLTTAVRLYVRPVVMPFTKTAGLMNGGAYDYRSHTAFCSHPVVTRKPAEMRRFLALTTITTLKSKKKEKREKRGLGKDTRARRRHVVSLGGVVA